MSFTTWQATVFVWSLFAATRSAADVSGPWRLEFQQESARATFLADCVWEQEGTRMSGGCTSGFDSIVSVRGSVQDGQVTFCFRVGAEAGPMMTFRGQLNDTATAIEGTWRSVDGQGGATGGGTFTATKR